MENMYGFSNVVLSSVDLWFAKKRGASLVCFLACGVGLLVKSCHKKYGGNIKTIGNQFC